jgi:3-deoxy-7-phosphoheptulonate synthase
MMIVMKASATEEEIQSVIGRIESCGARAHPSRGEEVTVIGAIGDREHVARLGLEGHAGVEQVVPILKPYKLASSQLRTRGERTVVEIDGRKIGGEHFSMIAGPCTVESRDQLLTTRGSCATRRLAPARRRLQARGRRPTPSRASGRRGCACSPRPRRDRVCRSSPSSWTRATSEPSRGRRRHPGRAPQHAELPAADGDRPLGRPRAAQAGASATLEELLMAAEYILKEGNPNVLLCERGIRTFETAYRYTLDLTAIPVLQQMTHLPVLVDPSHDPDVVTWCSRSRWRPRRPAPTA